MKAPSLLMMRGFYNSAQSRMRSLLAKHTVQRLSSKRVRQIEIRAREVSPVPPPSIPSSRIQLADTPMTMAIVILKYY